MEFSVRHIIGIDQSLHSTGIIIMNESGLVIGRCVIVPPQGCVGIDRLMYIENALTTIFQSTPITGAYMEGYAYGLQGAANFELGELGGIVKRAAYQAKVPLVIVPPATVKRFATGKGNAKKDEIRLAVYKRWGFEAVTNDEVDAYVIARIGLVDLGLAKCDTADQLVALEAIHRPKRSKSKAKGGGRRGNKTTAAAAEA
jgi:crossover junction endodeoxyribonuclease RuvC